MLTLRVETDSFASIQIAALENGTFAAAQLNIDYTAPVPEPQTLLLMLLGLPLLAWVVRRNHH